jgi:hypothetical protein
MLADIVALFEGRFHFIRTSFGNPEAQSYQVDLGIEGEEEAGAAVVQGVDE